MLRSSLLLLVVVAAVATLSCLVTLAGAQTNGKCPSGWVNRPSSDWCYQMSDNSNLLKTWTEAKMACELQHSSLLSIADQVERAWLAGKINPYAIGDRFWWFGLSRFDGSWKWDDGHTGNEQPGNLVDGSLLYYWTGVSDSTPGDCMTIYQDLGSKNYIRVWPQDCNKKYKYVCKAGWTAYGQACFLFVANAATWEGALAICSSNGGQLASIHDLWEQSHVHFRTETIGRISTWIGLRDAVGNGQYAWSDAWPVTYTNWGRGQPNGGGQPNCVNMDYSGGWVADDCNKRLPFMCRQSFGAEPTTVPQLEGTCPDEFVPFGDSCYYTGNNTESRTAQEAQYECSKRYRSTLVSILSQGEQNFVAAQIRAKSEDENKRKDYWIGLIRGGDGGFEWFDFSPVSYLYWSKGEPSNTPNENCVEMYHLNLKWNDHYCTKRNSFVCKMPKQPATGSSTTTGPRSVSASTATRFPPHTPPPGQSTSASTTPEPTRSPEGIRSIADLTNNGLVAGVVILFIVILAVLVTAVFFYRRQAGPKLTGEAGYGNANWSKGTDEVNLENSSAPRVQIQLDAGLENPSYSS